MMSRDIAYQFSQLICDTYKNGGRAWVNESTGQAGIEPHEVLREEQRDFLNRNMPEFAAMVCGYVIHARAFRMLSHYGLGFTNTNQITTDTRALEALIGVYEKKHGQASVAIGEGLYYFIEYGHVHDRVDYLIKLGRHFAKELIQRMEHERSARQKLVDNGMRQILGTKAAVAMNLDPFDDGLIKMLSDLGQE